MVDGPFGAMVDTVVIKLKDVFLCQQPGEASALLHFFSVKYVADGPCRSVR